MLTGYFEAVDFFDGHGWFIKGWAFDNNRPDRAVPLELWSQNGVLAHFIADQPRPDLTEAGIGSGNCAFELLLPDSVLDGRPHMLHVVAPEYKKALLNSPIVFAMPRFRGRLESIQDLSIAGWAKDELDAERPVTLDLLIDGRCHQLIKCATFREDLPRSLGTSGHNAFRDMLPLDLCDGRPHEISLRFTNTDQIVSGCPFVIEVPPVVVPPITSQINTMIVNLEREMAETQALLELTSPQWLNDRHRYHKWLALHETRRNEPRLDNVLHSLPTFSILRYGEQDINALTLFAQGLDGLRSEWELLVAADELRRDSRMRVIEVDPDTHPAGALTQARGEFILILPNQYRPHPALLQMLLSAVCTGEVDAVYVDEDVLDCDEEHHSPHFKPDWDPDHYLATNYIGGTCCIRVERLRHTLRKCQDSSRSWQALIEQTLLSLTPARVRHIPNVLIHRTMAFEDEPASHRAERLQSILTELSWPVQTDGLDNGIVRIHWSVPKPAPAITLIIPTRDRVELIRTCVDSILERTRYDSYNILVVDNGSTDPASLDYLTYLDRKCNIDVLRRPGVFNFSALNNDAVMSANTPLVGMINNDIEVLDGEWLAEMVSHAIRPDVGAVGAKLLYPNNLVQHCGVVVGFGGVAENAHKGLGTEESGYFNSAIVARQSSAVTAACLICRRDLYLQVGGFDADAFPVSFNDVDFCLKLRQRGLKVILTPYAVLRHRESASRKVGRTPESHNREALEAERLRMRWKTDTFQDPFYSPNLTRTGHSYRDFAWPTDWVTNS